MIAVANILLNLICLLDLLKSATPEPDLFVGSFREGKIIAESDFITVPICFQIEHEMKFPSNAA